MIPKYFIWQPQWKDKPQTDVREVCVCAQARVLRHVWLFVTPWTVAHEAPLSMEFSRQEYWSGLSSSRGFSRSRDQTHISCVFWTGWQILYQLRHLGSAVMGILLSKVTAGLNNTYPGPRPQEVLSILKPAFFFFSLGSRSHTKNFISLYKRPTLAAFFLPLSWDLQRGTSVCPYTV